MSKLNEIIDNKKYPELSGFLSDGMSLKETVRKGKYSALITKESGSSLRTTIADNGVMLVTIKDSKNNVIEKYVTSCYKDNELEEGIKTAIKTYEAIDDIEDTEDSFDIINDEDNSETVLTEEPDSKFSSLEMGLVSVRDSVVSVADDVKALSDMTNDIEMTTIVMDIANTLYSVALDIEDSIETYDELKAEDDIVPDDTVEDTDNVDVESVKADLRRSLVQVRKLRNKDLVESCRKLLRGLETLN